MFIIMGVSMFLYMRQSNVIKLIAVSLFICSGCKSKEDGNSNSTSVKEEINVHGVFHFDAPAKIEMDKEFRISWNSIASAVYNLKLGSNSDCSEMILEFQDISASEQTVKIQNIGNFNICLVAEIDDDKIISDNNGQKIEVIKSVNTDDNEKLPVKIKFLEISRNIPVGSYSSFKISVVDENDSPIVNYVGSVQFSSSDPTAILPKKYKFTVADKGVHSFDGKLLFNRLGVHSLSVKDAGNSGLKGQAEGLVSYHSEDFALGKYTACAIEDEVEMSWVGDFNPKMAAIHEAVGGVFGKKHITYRRFFSDKIVEKRSTIIPMNTKEKISK